MTPEETRGETAGARPGERREGLSTWVLVAIGLGVVTLVGCGGLGLFLILLVTPNVVDELGEAQQNLVRVQVEGVRTACDEYAVEHRGVYPDSLMDLEVAGYGSLSAWEDPWGRLLVYVPPEPGQGRMHPSIGSYGADGAPGGEGVDADVGFE